MSSRDRRMAEKYAKKGMKSASQEAAEKEARRNRQEPATGSVVEALRNFDPDRPKETAVPRDDESKARARSHRFGLPRIGG